MSVQFCHNSNDDISVLLAENVGVAEIEELKDTPSNQKFIISFDQDDG